MKLCHACKQQLTIAVRVGRRDTCPFCRAELYCCLNCEFYDRTVSKECREPVAELVKEKQKANYCDYFRIAESAGGSPSSTLDKTRKELDDLFKQ